MTDGAFICVRYLKKSVLPEMEELGELEQVYLRRGKPSDQDENGARIDHFKSPSGGIAKIPTNLGMKKEEWRWRLVPDFVVQHKRDPHPDEMFEARRQKAAEKVAKERRWSSARVPASFRESFPDVRINTRRELDINQTDALPLSLLK